MYIHVLKYSTLYMYIHVRCEDGIIQRIGKEEKGWVCVCEREGERERVRQTNREGGGSERERHREGGGAGSGGEELSVLTECSGDHPTAAAVS